MTLTPPRTWAEAYEDSGTTCQAYGWWDAAITDFTASARMWERVALRPGGEDANERAERCWRAVAVCCDRRADELMQRADPLGQVTKSMAPEGARNGTNPKHQT